MKMLICCSKYFYHKIERIKKELEQKGHKIALPNSYNHPMMEEELKERSKEEHIKWKAEMMKKDKPNIKPNDAILVLNYERKGHKNYIGGATFLEIYTAWNLKKKIFILNEIPNCSFTDELKGINPILLKGNLSLIK